MEEKLKLKYPVIVEGKYDKAKVCAVVETSVIPLGGFSVFNNSEKQQLLKKLARNGGIILLTDSDRAGNFLRAKLKGIIGGKIYNVYSPVIAGKEKRKNAPSADGLLGVEGISESELKRLLSPFQTESINSRANITYARYYSDGFSGGECSLEKRKKLAGILNLPETLSSKALLEAINLSVTEQEYESAVMRIKNE